MPQTDQYPNLTANYDGTYNSYWPNGDKGTPASGGDQDLSWSAPQGRGNRLPLIVTSSTIDFGTAPKNITLGFGRGWMDDADVGDPLQSHVDIISGEYWEYENDGTPKRHVSTKLGFKSLITTGSVSVGGGMMNWDAGDGEYITDNVPIFYSSWVQATAKEIGVEAGTSQWKTYRTGADKNLDEGHNSGYHKIFVGPEELDKELDGEYTRYSGTGSGLTTYGLTHPTLDNRLTRHDVVLFSGDYGSANGKLITKMLKPVNGNGMIETINNDIQFYFSESGNKFRWMKVQDFVQHIVGVEIHRTDFYWQVGTLKRFEMADGIDPQSSTDSKILPHTEWSDSEVKLHIWGQSFGNNLNKYLHYYNDAGEFVTGVPL